MSPLQQYIDKAAILVEALPYIQSFRGKTVVVKYGGSTMKGADDDTVLKDLVFMESVGINPVIVHGGGPAIDRQLKAKNIETQRVNGLRITDQATMQVVEETLFGEVNAGIVDAVRDLGGQPVAVSARDAGILQVRKHMPDSADGPIDIGFVGEVEHVDPQPLTDLLQSEVIPVIAPIGRGPDGEAYNVNADTAAGEIAAALHAEKLVFLTDVTGIMERPGDEESLLSTLHVRDVEDLIDRGVVGGGMIPKTRAGVHAVRAGVHKAHIIDGRIPHSVLLEFFTDEGVGTQIVQ
ncbi:MAG: acetylglutamate kinase [Gemmatimonadetes bacterium]|jgi:acetylglutamate kinase|nr:acetylglutamate kinase [Gemmatimonadota bacterium]MBT4609211.1 acetylglutamate kinase [Gemmatimonadota bacterium]MBT5055576.1 acetylglutamate kinase [Gemmatimonadota bacterium]MBT5143924.1 acetylglutamate kinase [Gemmatimonadota bacterium]MBT5588637.1 acetylglutamate kinase [Gemmatimonadota bacterium]